MIISVILPYIFRVDISTFVVVIFTDDNEFISILL